MSVPAVRTAVRAAVRRALDAATAPAIVHQRVAQQVWLKLLTTRALTDAERARLARVVAGRLRDAGDPQVARQVFAETAGTLRDGGAAADLAWSAADLQLGLGETPADLDGTLRRVLAFADAELRAGRGASAAEQLARAFALAFHRTLQFDHDDSPLAADPEVFLAPFRDSATYQKVVSARRGRAQPVAGPVPGRPHRLLFVSYRNWKFLPDIIAHYESRSDVEVRRLDLADLSGLPLSPTQLARLRLTGPVDTRSLPWAAPIAEEVDWADTVFMEWGQRGAALLSTLDPGTTRVVVRLHSFEAFTAFPHLVDWSRVDGLVFVAPHVESFTRRVAPLPSSLPTHVVANHAVLTGYRRPKASAARFTLALVGWGTPAKDTPWALDVLARLRAGDERWRLLLVGADVDPALTRYRDAVESRLRDPALRGAVERTGFVDDVAGVLERVGVILSTSARESFHLGLVEGAASGAVPVVRNWPLFAAYGGAHALFPDDWIVETPADAAESIRRRCADEETWRREGAAAADTVLSRYDWSAVAPHLDALLLGAGG